MIQVWTKRKPVRKVIFLVLIAMIACLLPANWQEAEAAADSKANVIKLSSDVMKYESNYAESRQIPNTAQKGVYFLNENELTFYSLEMSKAEKVYTFSDMIQDSYESGNKLYVLERFYNGETKAYEEQIAIYDLNEKKFEGTVKVDFSASAIGVDQNGRLYLAGKEDDTYYIYLLSSDGSLLSKAEFPEMIYDFGGFDSVTGNFYFEHYYNWVSWGYDHDMRALGIGSVKGNKIQLCTDTITTLICQNYFYDHQRALDVVGNKYLCIDNTFYSGLEIWSSAAIDPAAPEDTTLLYLERDNNDENGEFDHLACVGPRAVYNSERNSVITFKDKETLAEYIPETEQLIGEYKTAHPVFSLANYGDEVIAIEKDGNDFYLEVLECKAASYLKISGDFTTIAPASRMQLTADTDGSMTDAFQWTSSNSKIASVTQSGEVFAWRKGEVTITVRNQTGLSDQYKITVSGDAAIETPKSPAINLTGKNSANLSANNYLTYGNVINSYLVENEDNTLTRVEYISGKVVVENYNAGTGTLSGSKTLNAELNLFGGFFSGSDYNYVVYGQINQSEKDDAEVLRVVKYSKNWERIGQASACGANTYIPFAAGSLRMAETDGKLYVYTCHEMYASEDGYHHQANMTYVINESDMSIAQSYYDVLNLSQAGYISHSFNQFVQTDGKYVYRVDHGDGYPRAVSITRCNVDGAITNVKYTLPLSIGGQIGANSTGVSIGGFELSTNACLIAGNSVPQGDAFTGTDGQRNIFVTVTSKDLSRGSTVWITKYKGEITTVDTPHIVKLGKDQFLLMWEEYNKKTKKRVTKMVTIDDEANMTSDVIPCGLPLSDCKPVLRSDGLVSWYVSNDSAPILYTVNPYNLESVYLPSYTEDVEQKAQKITAKSYTKTYGSKPFKLGAKTNGNGKLTYKSSNTKVAAVSSAGKVTLKGTGKATITITAAATDTYKAATKKITITVKPKKVAGLKLKAAKKKMTVTWKRDTKATGYQVTYALNSKFTKSKKNVTISKNKTTKKVIKKLKSGKTYYVKIRAYKKVGSAKLYGSYSAVKKIKVK